MPDWIHPQTLAIKTSEPSMPDPWLIIARDAETAAVIGRKHPANRCAKLTAAAGQAVFLGEVQAIAKQYRKWVVDHVEEMSAAEKLTADGTFETQRQADEIARYDRKDVLRATILVLVDELNATRQWIASFKTEVAASTSLNDLKTRVAGLPAMPDRTATQARTAIVNKLTVL